VVDGLYGRHLESMTSYQKSYSRQLKKIPAKFYPDDGALGFFKERRPTPQVIKQ